MIFIPFISFLALFIYYQKINKRNFGVVSYLIAIYLASSFCAIILYYFFDYSSLHELDLVPTIYFISVISLILSGFFRYKDRNISGIVLSNIKLLKSIDFMMVPLSLAALLFFASQIFITLGGDIAANRDAVAAGDSIGLSKYGLFNSIFSLVANLFLLNLLFSFLNFSDGYPRRSAFRGVIHLVLSTVYIFYILAYIGRDGFVFWGMSFLFFFILFKDFINSKDKQKIIIGAIILSIPALLIFIQITVSRFGADGIPGILFALIDYSGQQIFYFNDHFRIDPPPMYGLIGFEPVLNLISWLMGETFHSFDRQAWFEYFLNRGVIPWTFVTFIGSFIHDFGKIGTIFVAFLIYCSTKKTLACIKNKKLLLLPNMIILILIFQIVSWGVFYYRQYSAFYYLIAVLIFFLLFKFSAKTEKIFIKKAR